MTVKIYHITAIIILAFLFTVFSGCRKNSDTTPPSITLSGFNPIEACVGRPYNDAGATAFDDTDGDVTDNIQVSIDVDTSQPGEGTVTYSVTDEAGNTATAVREVVVIYCQ